MFNKHENQLGIASDHIGYELKMFLIQYLEDNGWRVKDFGAYSTERTDYPQYAKKLATAVSQQEVSVGIVICGTGIGVSIAANKVKGARCALCSEEYSAKMSRMHNNANILAMGARVIGSDMAISILDAWLSTDYEGGRHEKRVQQINEM